MSQKEACIGRNLACVFLLHGETHNSWQNNLQFMASIQIVYYTYVFYRGGLKGGFSFLLLIRLLANFIYVSLPVCLRCHLAAFKEFRTPNCGPLCYQSPFPIMVILDPAVVIHPLSGLTNPPKPRSLLKIF
jgi:hypothetical protein